MLFSSVTVCDYRCDEGLSVPLSSQTIGAANGSLCVLGDPAVHREGGGRRLAGGY